MNKKLPGWVGVLVVIAVIWPGQAAGHGIGADIIRWADGNQDGGMKNIYGQLAIAGDAALILGYSTGDDLTIWEGGARYYFGRYMNATFLQLGIGYHDRNGDDDYGFIGALGYERKLTGYIAVSGAVQIIAGVDRAVMGYDKAPVFQPVMRVMVAF